MSKRTLGRLMSVSVVALSLVAALTGCGSGSQSSATTDTIRTRFGADPTGFDPALLTAGDDFYASRLLFDTLLRYNDKGAVVGGLASKYNLDASGGTMTIRDGATCEDGTKIDAKVVADSLTRFASPETKSSYKSLVFGGGDVSVQATGGNTISIKLSQPFSEITAGLTMVASGIVCPAGLKDLPGLKAGKVAAAFSGPYKLTEAKNGVNYTFKLRDGYKAWPTFIDKMKGKPAKTIQFSVGSDQATNANEILGGSLDVARVDASDVSRFTNVTKAINGEQYIVFNESETSPFRDQKLRTAVAQLLSADAYNKITYAGKSEVEYTVGDSGMQCANTDKSLIKKYDPASVKASGILKGVKIKYEASNNFGPNGAGAEYVYQQLIAAGADVDYKLVDNSSWASVVLGPDPSAWDITLFGTVNQTGTLWTSVSRLLGTPIENGGRSMTRAQNPDGEALASQVMAANDTTSKCKAYQQLQKNILDRVDVVPFTASPLFWAVRDGFAFNAPNGRMDLTTLRIND